MPGLAQLVLISALRRYVHLSMQLARPRLARGHLLGRTGRSLAHCRSAQLLRRRKTNPGPTPVMSNPSSPGRMQAHCYSRADAAISAHSLPNPGPEVVSQQVGEAVSIT